MPETMFNVSIPATTAPNGGEVAVATTATSAGGSLVPNRMPASVPADQAYYWSFAWQAGVREAMAALDAGEYEDFDSDDPNDVVRWFLSDR